MKRKKRFDRLAGKEKITFFLTRCVRRDAIVSDLIDLVKTKESSNEDRSHKESSTEELVAKKQFRSDPERAPQSVDQRAPRSLLFFAFTPERACRSHADQTVVRLIFKIFAYSSPILCVVFTVSTEAAIRSHADCSLIDIPRCSRVLHRFSV